MRSSVKNREKGSDGPRKAIRKNYGTYPRKEIREAKGKNWSSFCSEIEKGTRADRLNRLLAR